MKQRFLMSIVPLFILGLSACDRPMAESSVGEVNSQVSERQRVILVTGATGTQGGAVAEELLKRGYAVRGLTRNTESDTARALANNGVDMVQGDFNDAASLEAAMDGVDGVFGVTLFWPEGYESEVTQGKRLIDAAVKAGIGRFVLTSVAGADDETGLPHFESKWEVEQYLHQSDLDWTVVRPVEFMDNWWWQREQFFNGQLIDPRPGDSSHQWIAARDIGFFVAEAFDNPESWKGVTLEIAGDELTVEELRMTLSRAYGREFTHVRPSWEAFEQEVGEEITIMYQWFEEEGYDIDIEALRSQYPGLQTADEFLTLMAGDAAR